MTAVHDVRLAEFLALDATGAATPDRSVEQDMGALKLAYAEHWRPDTLSVIPGREGRYGLAADWLATAFLLVRNGGGRGKAVGSNSSWEIAGVFSENHLFIGRPHRGALLSIDLQLYGFVIRGGRVGRLPAYTPIGLTARKAAYRVAVRRAIAAGLELSEPVLGDYRELVKEKKERDEAGQRDRRDMGGVLAAMKS